MLISVKTATDLLTNCVARPPATVMALVSEIAIFPLIAIWLAVGNGSTFLRRRIQGKTPAANELRDIGSVFKDAMVDNPGRLLGIGAIYAFDNLVYFFAQSNVGAVTYTVLAQTKIFFTVGVLRWRNMLGKLATAQLAGLVLLFAGANLVALKDVATGVAATSGNRLLGISCLLFGQAITSAANVAYERRSAPRSSKRPTAVGLCRAPPCLSWLTRVVSVLPDPCCSLRRACRLREPGCDVWVRNVQLTGAITLWLAVSSAVRASIILLSGGVPPSPHSLLQAFCKPWVWLVVCLKAATAVLIALTIKAGGNVLYAISKPWPVVFATLATCVALGRVPSLGFIGGILCSIAGITLYYVGKPKVASETE